MSQTISATRLAPRSSAMVAAKPMSSPRFTGTARSRHLNPSVTCKGMVGGKPGYMAFSNRELGGSARSSGSVQFVSDSSRCAVGARPGFMSFSQRGLSRSSGAVQFSPEAAVEGPAGAGQAAVGSKAGFTSFSTRGDAAGAPSRSPGSVQFASGGEAAPVVAEKNFLQQWSADGKRLQQQLKALGVAGLAAYGLFNTAYYTGAFLFCWLYVAKVPHGLGAAVAARKFFEVLGLVWAGSQVTKLPRIAGALAFAPLVDRGLGWLQGQMKLGSKTQAFWALVVGCHLVAAVLFGAVVLAWA